MNDDQQLWFYSFACIGAIMMFIMMHLGIEHLPFFLSLLLFVVILTSLLIWKITNDNEDDFGY